MRAILTALMLTVATQAVAECGNLCDYDWWKTATEADVQAELDDFAGVAPLRGSCIGDGSSSYSLIENEDTSLTYSFYPNMPQWPIGEDIFADFTTAPIPVDEPPVWTENAPSDGAWIPRGNSGPQIVANWDQIQNWFEDEAGVSNLNLNCRGDSDLEISYLSLIHISEPTRPY